MVYKKIKSLFLIFFLICFAFAIYLLFINLGKYPLENWDEAYYGQATKEMLANHDFAILHWNYSVWLDKPPMYIWLTTLVSLFVGLSEFSMRFPSALSALIIIIATTAYAYKKYSFLPAVFAFFTLTFNNVFLWRARGGDIDLFVSLLIFITYFLVLSKNKYKYLLLGFVFSCIYLTKASLVAVPLVIFIFSEIFYERKKVLQNWKEYLKLVIIFFGVSGVWLSLGYFEAGKTFVNYYLFHADQGVATLSKFNPNYLWHVYYALERRFFWILLIGSILAIVNIKKRENFLLILYSFLLLTELSFTVRDNNWYLIPSMPFWSILIAYGIYSLLNYINKYKIIYVFFIISIVVLGGYTFSKTFLVNIKPILSSSSTIDQAASAKQIDRLAKKTDVVVRLDALLPTTLYYSNRKTLAYFQFYPDSPTHTYWINLNDLISEIKNKKVQWLVGTTGDVDNFLKNITEFKYTTIGVGNEKIIKFTEDNI